MVQKFHFNFKHFNNCLSGLSDFVDKYIELDSKYHIILFSSDCEVLCGGHGLTNGVHMEFVFSDFNSVKTFISHVNEVRNDWFKCYSNHCCCTTFSCFNIVDVFFIKYEGDISLHDLIYKVMNYEGINYRKCKYLQEGFIYKYIKYLFSFVWVNKVLVYKVLNWVRRKK